MTGRSLSCQRRPVHKVIHKAKALGILFWDVLAESRTTPPDGLENFCPRVQRCSI